MGVQSRCRRGSLTPQVNGGRPREPANFGTLTANKQGKDKGLYSIMGVIAGGLRLQVRPVPAPARKYLKGRQS